MSNEHCHGTWIKMSDRKPFANDLPVVAYDGVTFALFAVGVPLALTWTHWKQFRDAPPIEKEPTRDEQDRAGFIQYHSGPEKWDTKTAWYAGLRHERSCIGGLLDKYTANDITIQQLVAEIKEHVK